MKHKLVLAALILLPFSAISAEAEKEEKSPYKASAELGALYKTGNKTTADILAGFDADYEKDVWRAALRFDLLVRKTEKVDSEGKEDLVTTDQKWNVGLQVNHTLNSNMRNYLYGNATYEDNRFSGFDNQWSVSTGWGRRWYETKVSTFDADFGPGFKRDVISPYQKDLGNGDYEAVPSENRDSFIVQAQMKYTRKLNKFVEFKQFAVAKWATKSGENSQFKAETSITTKLIETLQLKFSFKIDHNTEVDDGKDNTLTQTGITLVYSF
ncbi:MAG: DUF481 domain-containing protein [Thalassotalea sp.]